MWPTPQSNVKRFLFTRATCLAGATTNDQTTHTEQEQCKISWFGHINATS
jgi:hypothetical protein